MVLGHRLFRVGMAVAALGSAACLFSCGRVDYEAIGSMVITSPGGTTLPPGSELELDISLVPRGLPGVELTLVTDGGHLRRGSTRKSALTLTVAEDGTIGPVFLVVPLEVDPARVLTISSQVPVEGDVRFEVREPVMQSVSVDGFDYAVHEGFEVDAPVAVDATLRADLVDRVEDLAFAEEGSEFGEEIYLGLGAPPAVLRSVFGVLAPMTEVTDPARQTDALTQISFPVPDAGYGDLLYVCTTTPGDGLLAIDVAGALTAPPAPADCEGLVFDHETRLDYDVPFESPLYIGAAGSVGRMDSAGAREVLADDLPVVGDHLRLIVCPKDFLHATLILLSPGDVGLGADGSLIHVNKLVPYEGQEVWLEGLPEPRDAAFTQNAPWGWVMFLALAGADEIRGVRRDGSTFTLLTGISQPTAIVRQGDALWVAGRGRGELIRIRPVD